MPVVMLLLILMPLTMAGGCACCASVCFWGGAGRAEGWPFWPGPSCSCWRSGWGRRPAGDSGPGLAAVGVRRTGGGSCHRRGCAGPPPAPGAAYAAPGAESLGRICSYLTVLVLAACLGLLSMLGLWRDRVRGVGGADRGGGVQRHFRETGYRYVNWFVHGEQVYVGGLRQWAAADGPDPGGGGGGPDSPVRGRLPAGAGRPGLAVLGPKPDGAGTVRPPLPGDLVWAPGTGGAPRVGGRWPEIVLGLAGGAALVGLALFLLLFVFSCGIMTESASGRDRLWWRSTGESTGGAISAPGSADMKAGSSGGGAGAQEVTRMDTVSWLSFFYRLRPGGRPWGAVP